MAGIPDFAAKVFNMNVNKVGHGKRIKGVPPYMLRHIEAGDRTILIVQQKLENRKLLWG